MDKFKLLKEWINNDYLNPQTIMTIKQAFHENNPKSIQLQNFLKNNKFKILQKAIMNSKYDLEYKPDCYSFYKIKKSNKIIKEFIKFIESKEFRLLISFINNKITKLNNYEIVKFQHKNYTLLHDNLKEKQQLRLIFDFTEDWNHDSGGFNSYINNSEELLRINPKENSLSIIQLNEKILNFTKYINNQAKNNKAIFLRASFQ